MVTSTARVRPRTLRRLSQRLAAALICGVITAGCASPSSSPQTATPDTLTPSTSSTPPPISPQAYETELRMDGDALRVAIDGIGSAPPLDLLAGQVDSAASAVRDATQRLTPIVPPAQYAAEHADLLGTLNNLASQLSAIGAQVQSRELCTAPSVMATVSTLPEADALRRAAAALGPSGAELSTALPVPQPLPDRHETNGAVLRAPGSGLGELTVENNTGHDVVMALSRGGSAVGSIYVARGQTARLEHIANGTYDVYFTGGDDWDGTQFTRSCSFKKLDNTASFTTSQTPQGTLYRTLTIQLSVLNGNTGDVDVPPASFPR